MELPGYQAARERAASLVRSSRSVIELNGRDRASYLQGLLTNDVLALAPGSGCYAAYLTPQGRMISDMTVLHVGDRLVLDVPGAARATLVRRLEEFIITEDVQVTDLTDTWTSVGVYGPAAAGVAADAVGLPAETASPLLSPEAVEHRSVTATFDGGPLIVAVTREAGVPGVVLYLPRQGAASLLDRLSRAGVVALAPDAFDVLRVEAGRPVFGLDMDEHTIPLEAGIEDRAISFSKGCYVGQEIIVRILHRGQGRVARRLVGLILEPAEVSSPHASVPARGAVVSADATAVGRVTSAVYSPALGTPIALAMVQREFSAPGTRLAVVHEARTLAARVTTLPFVRS